MNLRPVLLALGCAGLAPLALSSCSGASEDASPDEAVEAFAQAPARVEAQPAPVAAAPRPRRGMVRFRPPGVVTPDVNPVCKSPKLAYFGGPLLQNPVNVPVYWSSSVNSEIQQKMASFYADIEQTSYWTWLHEYDTVGISGGTGQTILPGTGAPGVVLVPSRCASAQSCSMTDAELQNELSA